MYATYKPGDIVWIHGVTDSRTNLPCRGVIHHSFSGHWKGDIEYVIAVDILDGGFEVRSPATIWGTDKTYGKDRPRESQEVDYEWLRYRGLTR